MSEKPIIFSTEMVRAILDGRKSQTRRVIKPQPERKAPDWKDSKMLAWVYKDKTYWCDGETMTAMSVDMYAPYQPGDVLWVRESFQPRLAEGVEWQDSDYETGDGYNVSYVATDGILELETPDGDMTYKVTPSIHMPRWAARLFLRVKSVRAERLQDISLNDCMAEGIKGSDTLTPYGCFVELWNKLNAKRGYEWAGNPWVWVIEFERINGGEKC
jgi:hypothetical protein